MADIFISYSSKDREKAEQLTELLGSAGLSVWIDKHGIEAATSWSKEIVQAIDNCKALLVLLSPHSVLSVNVAKEVSLAAEQKKKILPLDLEPVELTDDLRYHLAGIQRTAMTNIDAIIRAIGKLGLEATQAPTLKLVQETDSRKSLMILPFEDLSPTGDNGWFADGIASELITALTHIKALRVADQQATKDFKRYTGTLPVYAREMNIRYFIQGDVRKFGDQIKITSRLLDIETGDHLWQDSLKGIMDDIFDIQEKVALHVVGGLKIHLSTNERFKLDEWGTESAEAYEYYMRALELVRLPTQQSLLQAIRLLDLSLELDSRYWSAMITKVEGLYRLFRSYDRDPSLLREAELLLLRFEELRPGGWEVHNLRANIYLVEGRADDAEREHREHIATDDGSAISQSQLGYYCFATKQYSAAFEYYEAVLKMNPSAPNTLWNVLFNAQKSKNKPAIDRWSNVAIAAFQKQLRLHAEEAMPRYFLAATYSWSNRTIDSLQQIDYLESLPDLDSEVQYRVAALLAERQDDDRAVDSLRKALNKGFVNFQSIRDAESPFKRLFGNPKFEVLMSEIDAKSNG